ncbi:MAG: hypothetical protein ACE5MI_04225 [Acidimicrobiia bacterium]
MTTQPAPRSAQLPNLRLVQGVRGRRFRAYTWVAFSILAMVVFFALIAARTSLDRTAFELAEIDRQISEEQTRFEELRLEIARLSSPKRIAPLAEAMGMVLPQKVTRISASGVIRFEADREERWAEMKPILAGSP